MIEPHQNSSLSERINSNTSAMNDSASPVPRFIGRQPILDADGNAYGYELLFREGSGNEFSGDGDQATRSVIDNCLLMMHENNREMYFLNCTRDALLSGLVTLLPPSNFVLEVLEDIIHDSELIECCLRLKEAGYRFALDDFSPDMSKLSFVSSVDFIKIDFMASNLAARREIYSMAEEHHVTFIAEKIETYKDLQIARAEGCNLFQGYFFCKPQMVPLRVIPQSQLIYLRLLVALARTPSDISEIEGLVMADASVCYRLLRLVNSPLYGRPSPVLSIRAALMIVGDNEFLKLVTVAMSNMAIAKHKVAATFLAIERAKFCELLAPLMNESPSTLYLLGMLSLIDVIVGMPMAQIMDLLPLDLEIKMALLGKPSSLEIPLDLVRHRQSGNQMECQAVQNRLGLTELDASRFCLESVQWADKVHQESVH